MDLSRDVPLSRRTTFELGGPARYFVCAQDDETVREALRWAIERREAVAILGGGSNLVVADQGFGGLVVEMSQRGLDVEGHRLTVAAGEVWEDVVAVAVEAGLAGLECLAGIPGRAGAVPIQNVGAYGQEVSETIESVRVFDRVRRRETTLSPAQCGFGYRDSAFKRTPDRHVVLSVTFALRPGGAPAVRYPELRRALGDGSPSLGEVRDTVVALRRAKSMVLDPTDPNTRCAGSFFTNPVVSDADLARLCALAVDRGVVEGAGDVPRFPAGDGAVKVPAAWLIERAGIPKGHRRGGAGVSTKHTLALVNHGGSAAELIALARHVRDTVHAAWGITLRPEPVMLGFDGDPLGEPPG